MKILKVIKDTLILFLLGVAVHIATKTLSKDAKIMLGEHIKSQ